MVMVRPPRAEPPSPILRPPTLTPVRSTVISVFAIIILTVLGILFRSGHEEFVGGRDDPTDGKAVSGTIFTAVIVYGVRVRPRNRNETFC